jgi:hypothetical protein
VRALQVVGRKKSGKTSLILRLLPLLRARGLRIGTVKHSSHPHPLDRPGSDSMRHRQAGAEATLVISAAAAALHFPAPAGDEEGLIERMLGALHSAPGELLAVVLAPGLSAQPEALAQMGFAPASAAGSGSRVPWFGWAAVPELAEQVMAWYERRE